MRLRLASLLLAAVLGLAAGGAPPPTGREPRVRDVATLAGAPVVNQDSSPRRFSDYAPREASSADLETFEGGHEVIIVSSCVVVAVILILVLI